MRSNARVRSAIEVNNWGNVTENLAPVDEYYAPDFVFHDPNIPFPTGGIRSCEDYKQFLIGLHTALSGHLTIEDLITERESARDVEIVPCPAIRS